MEGRCTALLAGPGTLQLASCVTSKGLQQPKALPQEAQVRALGRLTGTL